MKRKLQNLWFTLLMAVAWTSAYGAAVVETGTKMIVVSDIHVMAPSLLPDAAKNQSAWKTYYAGQRKMLEESAEYFASFTEYTVPEDAKLLLITGDLTKDGEQASHNYVKDKLTALKNRVSGIKIFVIPGNHDFGDEGNCTQFNADGTTSAATKMTTDDFATFYADYGYGTGSTLDPNGSLSYVAEPIDGLVLLAIDSHNGSVPAATLTWICEQATAAKEAGKQVIAMMHHPLFPHITGADLFISTYAVNNSETVRNELVKAGVKVILTGHFHTSDIAQDWASTSKTGESIYDINTGSLISYPCDYRTLTLSEDKKTLTVTTMGFDTTSKAFLQGRVAAITIAAIESKINAITDPTIKAAAMAVATNEVKSNLGSFAAGLFTTHADGNEDASAGKNGLLTTYNTYKSNATYGTLFTLSDINDATINSILEDKSNYDTGKADKTDDRTLSITMPEVSTPVVPDADGTVTVGTEKYAHVGPVFVSTNYCMTQQLYTKEQLGRGAGQLTSIAFNTVKGGVTRSLSVYVTHTTNTSVSGFSAVNASDLVFSGDVTFKSGQWNAIEFDKPFAYDGTSNLLVTIDDNTGTSLDMGDLKNYCYDCSGQCEYATGDEDYDPTNPPTNSTSVSWKAQMQFTFSTYPAPNRLAVADLSNTTARISCSLRSGSTVWNLRYRKAGTEAWTTLSNLVDQSKTLEGLTAATNYEVQVQGIFDGGKQSEWSSTLTFATNCCATEDMATIQYELEGPNSGWHGFAIQIVDAETGIEAAYLRSTSNWDAGFVSLCCGRKYDINWIYDDDYSWMASQLNCTLKFAPGDVFFNLNYKGASENKKLGSFVMDCTSYCAQRPVEVAASETRPTSVTLTYNSTTKKDQIVYSTNPEADPSTLTPLAKNKSEVEAGSEYTLENLEPLTTYYIWVRSVCEEGGNSRWSEPLEVTTQSENAAPSVVTATPVSSTKEQLTWTGYGSESKWNVYYRLFSSTSGAEGDEATVLISDDNTLGGSEGVYTSKASSSSDNMIVIGNIRAGKGITFNITQWNSAKNSVNLNYGFVKQDGKLSKEDLKTFSLSKRKELKNIDKTLKAKWKEFNEETDAAKKEVIQQEIKILQLQRNFFMKKAKKARVSAWSRGSKKLMSRANRVASASDSDEEYYFFYIEHEPDDNYDILEFNSFTILQDVNDWTTVPNVSPSDYMLQNLTPATTYETYVEPVYNDDTTGPESPITVFTTLGEEAEPVKGAFTTCADGTQISFAKGNLRYNRNTEVWSLAEHQYDILGEGNKVNTTTGIAPSATLDLFCWSTVDNDLGSYYAYNYSDESKAESYFKGDFSEWGESQEVIDCLGTGWRTLSKSEWSYVLCERPNADKLVAYATVNNVQGVAILPDEWETPAGISLTPFSEGGMELKPAVSEFGPYYKKSDAATVVINTYTADQWAAMEEAGAVFLPAAGLFSKGKSLDFIGEKGFYWSSTPSAGMTGTPEMEACQVWFTESDLDPAVTQNRREGSAVRLVKSADASASKTSIAEAVITLTDGTSTTETTQFTYTGKAIQPTVSSVTLGDAVLTADNDYTVSYNNNINAGTATVTITGAGKYGKTATKTFTIKQAPLTVTAKDNATTITYGDAPADLGANYEGFVNGETTAVLSGKLTITHEYKQFGKVGTYKMTPSGLSSANYAITYADGTLTVNPKVVTVEWSEPFEFDYDNQQHVPTANVKADDLVNGDKCEVIVSGAETNAGHYTVTATALSNENYKLPKTGLTQKFTINKVDIANITAAPTPKTGLTYSGEEQELIIPVTVEGGTMKFSLDGKNFSTDVPKGKDKKEYTVYYMVEGDANHKDTEPASLKVSIVTKVLTAQTTDNPSSKLTAEVTHEANKTADLTKVEPAAEATTITIPATIQGYRLTNITADALEGVTGITNIILPETDEPIKIAEGALPADVNVQVPLGQLAKYALDPALKELFEAGKIMTILTAVNDWFTLSAGVDVLLPEGLTAYASRQFNTTQVLANEISNAELTVDGQKVIKANNGILMKGEKGSSYEIIAIPGTKKSGDEVTTDNAQSYADNQLVPVIVPTNFVSGYYWALKNNEFHSLLDNGSKTPAGKAVLKLNGAAARVMSIVDGAVTDIHTLNPDGTDRWYDLLGNRIDKPTKKGIYILNGHKVVVK